MSTIVTRAGKGAPLSHDEVDANFVNLNADKLESTAFDTLAELNAIVADETIVGRDTTDTLTNKTLTAPTLTTPALGTPASGVMTNVTGTASGLTAGLATTVTTNANLTGHVTSTGNAAVLGSFTAAQLNTAVSDETMVGRDTTDTLTNKTLTSPTLTTPALGTPASGVMTNVTGVPVSALANGTDGELITWDAAGAPATVSAGTAAQVLTSNGAGAAPTFQAAAGGGGGGSGDILIPIDLVEFSDNSLVSALNFQDEEAKRVLDTVVFGSGEIGLHFPTADTAYDLVIAVGVSDADTSGTKDFSAQAYTYDANGTHSTLNAAVVKTSEVLPDAITTGALITWSDFIGASDISTANTRFKFGITLTAGTSNDHVGDLILRWIALRLAA